MNYLSLIFRNLLYHRKLHIAVCLGTAVSTAVIVGALIVGDSLRHSLNEIACARLGDTQYALASGNRFFLDRLASDMARDLGVEVAPLLRSSGIAVAEGGTTRLGRVQILGVDERFWHMALEPPPFSLLGNEAVVNHKLASRMKLKRGDELLLRVEKIDSLPREAPLSSSDRQSAAMHVIVKDIAGDASFGRFSLSAHQVEPYTVYLPLSHLAEKLEVKGRANVMLVAAREASAHANPISHRELDLCLRRHWTLADAGLELEDLGDEVDLESERVFLEQAVLDAALGIGEDPRPIFTYFVNEIRFEDRGTPYSFVSATGPPLVPPDMEDDEIVVSDWLAQDLGVAPGDAVELRYYAFGKLRRLEEKKAAFRVRSAIPVEGNEKERGLMPKFPGLHRTEHCRDWDSSVPIDFSRIRERDERYWQDYRGTPKAFVTYAAARRIWGNRFGSATAVRYRGATAPRIAEHILARLAPADVGLSFFPAREQGAGVAAVDFGQLFLGLGSFIVMAALILSASLFALGLDSRSRETGLLLAVGFRTKVVRRLFVAEGAMLSLVGGAIGTAAGMGYAAAVLYALSNPWHGAVNALPLSADFYLPTLLCGGFSASVASLAVIWLSMRKQVLMPIRELQEWPKPPGNASLRFAVAAGCAVGAAAIVATTAPGRGKEAAGAFFAAGTLALLAALAVTDALLTSRAASWRSFIACAFCNCTRRRARSMATIASMSCGVFLVIAVAANRHQAGEDYSRSSGTGGFALYVETSFPVWHDLNTDEGLRAFGLDPADFAGITFAQLRVSDGEDTSCLNLNRARRPRVVGVKPDDFASRGAFTFVEMADTVDPEHPWRALDMELGDRVVPGIADHTVIEWALSKKVGDTVSIVGEQGETFQIKLVAGLANSILQGSILLSERDFLRIFPSREGSNISLVDATAPIADKLSRALEDVGADITPCALRLAEFGAVENTYLDIFLALGGLGVILGSFGMGAVVARNVFERRAELALLRAVGFTRRSLRNLLLLEHSLLLLAGLACGSLSAAVAVLPAIASPGGKVPWLFASLTLAFIAASGLAWTCLATRLAMPEDLLSPLRNE